MGNFPFLPTAFDAVPKNYCDSFDVNALFDQNTDMVQDYWIIPGKSIFEKNLMFSLKTCQTLNREEQIRNIFKPVLKHPIPLTVIVSADAPSIHSVGKSIQNLRFQLSRGDVYKRQQHLCGVTRTAARHNVHLLKHFETADRIHRNDYRESRRQKWKCDRLELLPFVSAVNQSRFIIVFGYPLQSCQENRHGKPAPFPDLNKDNTSHGRGLISKPVSHQPFQAQHGQKDVYKRQLPYKAAP